MARILVASCPHPTPPPQTTPLQVSHLHDESTLICAQINLPLHIFCFDRYDARQNCPRYLGLALLAAPLAIHIHRRRLLRRLVRTM
jgi:hypothetical protein